MKTTNAAELVYKMFKWQCSCNYVNNKLHIFQELMQIQAKDDDDENAKRKHDKDAKNFFFSSLRKFSRIKCRQDNSTLLLCFCLVTCVSFEDRWMVMMMAQLRHES